MENNQLTSHRLTIDQRKKLHLTGATEIIQFDEDSAEIATSQGIVVVQGESMKLKCLSVDEGSIIIQGTINSVEYIKEKHKKGFFR